MDPNYCYALLAFLAGALSGFQGIHERYGPDSGRAALTGPGVAYLLVRGCIPTTIFSLGYYSGTLRTLLPLEAAAVGFATEAFLRSRFYIAKRAPKKGASTEDLLWGPLNFMRWLQGYFLEEAQTRITLKKQKIVEKYVEVLLRRLPHADFSRVCKIVEANALAYGAEPREMKLKESVLGAVAEMENEYDREVRCGVADAEREGRYIRKMAYWIFHNTDGRQGLELLLKPPRTT